MSLEMYKNLKVSKCCYNYILTKSNKRLLLDVMLYY